MDSKYCPTVGGVLYPPIQQLYDARKARETRTYIHTIATRHAEQLKKEPEVHPCLLEREA